MEGVVFILFGLGFAGNFAALSIFKAEGLFLTLPADTVKNMFLICAPQRSHKQLFVAVTCQAVYDNIRRDDAKQRDYELHILILCHNMERFLPIFFFQICSFKNMQQLEFDAV